MNTLIRMCAVIGIGAMATLAVAGQPTFTWNRTVDYTPHCCLGNLMAFVTAPNGTSLYLGDWYDDDIFYVSTPLTTDGTTDDISNTMTAVDAAGTWPAGGWSYQDGALDGDTLYIGGSSRGTDDAPVDPTLQTQLIAVTQNSPGVFTGADVTGIVGAYSGPDVVGAGKLVMANYDSNGLQFFEVTNAVATTSTAEIPNGSPTLDNYHTLSVDYDATSGLIFAYMVADGFTRRIDVFTSDGTAAGTSWNRTLVEPVASSLTVVGNSPANNHNRSAQITIIDKYRILICPFRDGANDGFDVFDIGTVEATETPYMTFHAAELNAIVEDDPLTPYEGFGEDITGSAMFTDGTNDYLALGLANQLSIQQVSTSTVGDWTIY